MKKALCNGQRSLYFVSEMPCKILNRQGKKVGTFSRFRYLTRKSNISENLPAKSRTFHSYVCSVVVVMQIHNVALISIDTENAPLRLAIKVRIGNIVKIASKKSGVGM